MPNDFAYELIHSYSNSGLATLQTASCFYVLYICLIASSNKPLWRVLLVHGASGMIGTLLENIYISKKSCCVDEYWPFLLAINEISWVCHESSTVLYSLLKLEIVILHQRTLTTIRGMMGIIFLAFTSFRVMIGYYRFIENTTMSFNIARAHSYAFICWGVADLILAFLLVLNTVEHLRKHRSVFITLLRSSILRMSVLIVNTAVISIVGQFSDPSPTISNINTIAWTIKGSYPMLLLIDIQLTKDMMDRKNTGASDNFQSQLAKSEIGSIKGKPTVNDTRKVTLPVEKSHQIE